MSCSPFDLKEYFLRELPSPQRVQVEAHVNHCPPCREELERLQLTEAALFSLRDEEIPQRIAFVSEPPHNAFGFIAGARREEGFRSTMAEAGLHVPASFVRYGAYLHSAARQMAIELLSLPDRPTAIVAASDVQAVGCLEAATHLDINVPDELSVVGYDDIDLAGLMGLSTVRQPLMYSGERGADLVLEALSMRNRQPNTEMLELELVVRATTAAVKRKGSR